MMDAMIAMPVLSGSSPLQAAASGEDSLATKERLSYAEIEGLLMQAMPGGSVPTGGELGGEESPVRAGTTEGWKFHSLQLDGDEASLRDQSDWLKHMQMNPETALQWLDEHAAQDTVQLWLAQALEALLALQQEQQAEHQQRGAEATAEVRLAAALPESVPSIVSVQEAKAVVQQLLQELQKQPDHIWLSQLSQLFQRMMKQGSHETVALPADQQALNSTGRATAERAFDSVILTGRGDNGQAASETSAIVWSTRSTRSAPFSDEAQSRLAFLAARHMSFDRLTGSQPWMTASEAVEPTTAESNSTSQHLQPVIGSLQQAVPHAMALSTVMPRHMSAQSFLQDMGQYVMNNFRTNTVNGVTEARFSLSPEQLGHVNVKITMHNGQLAAQFIAHSLLGREMLEGQMGMLRSALQQQGFDVERLEVVHGDTMTSSMFQHNQQQHSSPAPQQLHKRVAAFDNEEGTDAWDDGFGLAEGIGADNARIRLSNSDFDVTA